MAASNNESFSNGSSNAFWVHEPYGFLKLDETLFSVLFGMMETTSVPLTLFLAAEVVRTPRRRNSVVNLLVATSRLICFGILVAFPILLFMDNDTLCIAVYIVFPTFVLGEKLFLTSAVVIRYFYTFWPKAIRRCGNSSVVPFICLLIGVLLFASMPLITLPQELPPSYATCMAYAGFAQSDPDFVFLFVYFVIALNSILIDAFGFVKVLNYIRANLTRVTVVPDSAFERSKVQNVVTAPASLLIHLVAVFAMIPTSVTLLKSPDDLGGRDVVVQISYQLVFLFVSGTVIPILYIGSSAELREDVVKVRKKLFGSIIGDYEGDIRAQVEMTSPTRRAEIYAIRSEDTLR